jgi:hypothetical protein
LRHHIEVLRKETVSVSDDEGEKSNDMSAIGTIINKTYDMDRRLEATALFGKKAGPAKADAEASKREAAAMENFMV